jgi:hypothetical protein
MRRRKAYLAKDISDLLYRTFQAPLNVLGEYTKFHFCCCKKCQLLHASLHQLLNNREKIRHQRSNVCWHLLSGMNLRRDVQHYMNQIIGIFKVSSFYEEFMFASFMINFPTICLSCCL